MSPLLAQHLKGMSDSSLPKGCSIWRQTNSMPIRPEKSSFVIFFGPLKSYEPTCWFPWRKVMDINTLNLPCDSGVQIELRSPFFKTGASLFNLTFYIIQYTVYICRFFPWIFASNSKIQREHEGTVRLVVEEPSNQAPPFPILCSSAAKTQSWLHQHQTHRAYSSNNRKGETDAEYQQNASHMHLSLRIPVFPTQGSCQWREQHGNKQKKNEKDTLNKHP